MITNAVRATMANKQLAKNYPQSYDAALPEAGSLRD